ncbi:MAG: hypothetical protein M0Z52_11755 [Actinomycetota bacterium]|nr:hypothetical protein [Actinomycetota bacterium]
MRAFTDIHCHILPGLDDGPERIEQSIQMLQLAKADGLGCIAATPHFMEGICENTGSRIKEALAGLENHAAGIRLCPGADVRICRNIVERIRAGQIQPINGGNYVLLEMPDFVLPPIEGLQRVLKEMTEAGYTPVITHPERHPAIARDFEGILGRLRTAGAIFQVTAQSITGHFGKGAQKTSDAMLKKGLAHVVASDAHGPERHKRPPLLSGAYNHVKKKFGADYADLLFMANPECVVNGGQVEDLS